MLTVLASLVGAVVLFQLIASPATPTISPLPPPVPDVTVRAQGLERKIIYHSPQTPGYTSWTGAWIMPDKSLMTAFTQAIGTTDPNQRVRVPESILRKMDTESGTPERDFWGLDLTVEYLRSTDGGDSWERFRTESFKAPATQGHTPQPTIALKDGTLVRRVNGYDLRFDDSIPHTAFLQRLAPGADDWSEPQVLLDPGKYTYQLSRLRRLSDGRIIALGQAWEAPAGSPPDVLREAPGRLLLMASDDEGESWTEAMTIPSDVSILPNEWDAAELPNGNLVAVIRTRDPDDPSTQIRRQALLQKEDEGWVLTSLKDAPFPHSGHPELLATREGAILHIATSGVHYTTDGQTWKPLRFPRSESYASMYYPRSLQTEDGSILVFSHVGGDNGHGEVDQSIVMDRFRLKAVRSSSGG